MVVPGSLGSSHVGEGFFTAFNDAALEMCAKGEIDASLLADCMFPIYLPTEDVSKLLSIPSHPSQLFLAVLKHAHICMPCILTADNNASAHALHGVAFMPFMLVQRALAAFLS